MGSDHSKCSRSRETTNINESTIKVTEYCQHLDWIDHDTGLGASVHQGYHRMNETTHYLHATTNEYLGSNENEAIDRARQITQRIQRQRQAEREAEASARRRQREAEERQRQRQAEQEAEERRRQQRRREREAEERQRQRQAEQEAEAAEIRSQQRQRVMEAVTKELHQHQQLMHLQISQTKAAFFFQHGHALWQGAWQAERNDDSNLATKKFQEALSQFQQAAKCQPDNQMYCKYVKLAQYKLEGNSAFNEGLSLQEEGNRLQESKQYVAAAAKYVEALKSFKNGAALHHADAHLFNECAAFSRETLIELKTAIDALSVTARMDLLPELTRLAAATNRKVHQTNCAVNVDVVFEYLMD